MDDPRRQTPSVDTVLSDPALRAAVDRLGRPFVKSLVNEVLQRVRRGELAPRETVETVVSMLPPAPTRLRPVINATGVVVHTNLGRAPLSPAAREAILRAAGYTDVELDLATGKRARRGAAALAALRAAVPRAEAVHVVNNNAAALALVVMALAAGREILISRGEFIEIGDGFRIPELLTAAGARLREVGTTNRTRQEDYAAAIGPDTALILKLHPSNFLQTGFTSSVPVAALATLGPPVVYDIGSGLLRREPTLPNEPDVTSALRDGAALVTASGDKLLGGPQAGLIFGRAALVEKLRRHPLARAFRVDKLTLAALEATVSGPRPPVGQALDVDVASLRSRAERIATLLRQAGIAAEAVASQAMIGGGGAPGVPLDSAAVALSERYARPLRIADPAVLGRVHGGQCLLDLRTVTPEEDSMIIDAVRAVHAQLNG